MPIRKVLSLFVQVSLNNSFSTDVNVKKLPFLFLQAAENGIFFHAKVTGILISSSNILNGPSFLLLLLLWLNNRCRSRPAFTSCGFGFQ